MRRVAQIILAILLPVSAHATQACSSLQPVIPPLLTVYTISNTTIYPTATSESGLATTTAIDTCFSEQVHASIKIVLASDNAVKPYSYSSSNPGVIDPSPKVWNGKDKDGNGTLVANGVYTILISAVSTGSDGFSISDSSKTITVASPGDPASPDTPPDTTSTPVTTTSPSSGGSSTTKTTYIPPPSALTVDAGGNQNATMEVPLHFSARATIKSGTADSSAKIEWGFGDGSGAEGTAVEKTYSYAGTYLVVVTATDGVATGRDEFTVTVRPGQVHILGIRGTGVMIANDASERLDLSGWALFAGTHSFRIPNGTILLPKTSVLFSSAITKLILEQEVMLAYPDGDIASRYASSPEPVTTLSTENAIPQSRQPSLESASSNQVQTVESFSSPKTNVQSYDEAVIAPAATPDTGAAAGAAILPAPPLAAAVTAKTPATGLFHSVWTLGLLGVITLAGGAFILL